QVTRPSALFFFFQAEDGIRDRNVTGVQTCALPIEKQAEAEQKQRASDAIASEFVYAAVDPSRDYGFVAVAAGEGLKAVFADLSVDAGVSGGQTMNPATEDILAAVDRKSVV